MQRDAHQSVVAVRTGTCLILALLLASPAAPRVAHAAAATTETGDTLREEVLEIQLNEQSSGDMLVVLRDAAGSFWIEDSDFGRLRLPVPRTPARDFEGRHLHALNDIAGAQLRLDAARQQLVVRLPASAFLPERFTAPARTVGTPDPSATGAFLNYQLSGQRIGAQNTGGAYAELGLFGRPGVLTSSQVVRYTDERTDQVRLDTTFTRDFPDNLQTLNLGDAVSDPGSWGNAVRFAGIRFARNFAIRPDLVTTPLLTASGVAVVPSSVDVFVNNQRVLTQQVQPGPFTIDNLPSVTGAGNVRVQIRDALGREQTLVQPFYAGPSLLAAGLTQYAVDLGQLRQNYGLSSFDYGPWVGSASLRHGLTDAFTAEGHVEFEQDAAHAAGVNLASRLGAAGIAAVTAAYGGDAQSSGWLGGLSFEHRGSLGSLSASASYATSGYRQVGDTAISGERPKLRTAVQAGLYLGSAGSLSAAYAYRTFPTLPTERSASLTHSLRLGDTGYLQLTVSRNTGLLGSTSAFLTFTMALGPRRTLETMATGSRGDAAGNDELRATLFEAAPVGAGSGWRLGATTAGNYDADWQRHFDTVDLELESARNFNQTGQSVQLRGSATLLGGELRAARSIDGSFALVDLGGIPDVPVYLENHIITRTDDKGMAMLHNLQPYVTNRISIEPADVPIDTSLAARVLVVQPAFRSGVIARFPVEHVSPGVFRLVQADGQPVPAGARVTFNGGSFTVAMDGLTYVTTYDHGTSGIADWSGGRCTFRLEPPPAHDPQPDLGTIACRAPQGARP